MLACKENDRNSSQAESGADGTYQQQSLAAKLVNHRHRDHGEKQVGGSDGHRLQVARDLAEAGVLKDLVQIVENHIDARELVEYSDADREENRERILSGEKLFCCLALLDIDRRNDLLEVVLVVFVACCLQHGSAFGHSSLFD